MEHCASRALRWSVLLCAAAALPAQRTWVVDATGAGNFLDLPAAVGAANDGDTILVRPGRYRADSTTGKGLTIVGQGGTLTGTLRVNGLPASRTFALKNLAPTMGFPDRLPFAVHVTGCSGPVVLEGVTLDSRRGGAALRASQSALVALTSCDFTGVPAAEVNGGTLVATTSVLRGYPGDATPPGLPAGAGLVVGGAAFLSSCQVQGGDGATGWVAVSHEPGIQLNDGEARAAGSTTTITGGLTRQFSYVTQAPAVQGRGTITHDPMVTLGGGTTSSVGVVVQYVPALRATGAFPGNRVTVQLQALPGVTAAVLVSLPRPRQRYPFGDLWLDPLLHVPVFTGVVAPSGGTTLSVPVSLAYPAGLSWAFQAATLDPGNGLQLSDPAIVILH